MARLAAHAVGVQPGGRRQLGGRPGRRVADQAARVFMRLSCDTPVGFRELALDALGPFVEQDLERPRVRVGGHPGRVLVSADARDRPIEALDAAVAGRRRTRARAAKLSGGDCVAAARFAAGRAGSWPRQRAAITKPASSNGLQRAIRMSVPGKSVRHARPSRPDPCQDTASTEEKPRNHWAHDFLCNITCERDPGRSLPEIARASIERAAWAFYR